MTGQLSAEWWIVFILINLFYSANFDSNDKRLRSTWKYVEKVKAHLVVED